MVVSWLLPAVPGFLSNNHPPIYTPVTRLVDPIGELVIFVLLAVAFGVDLLRRRARKTEPGRSGYGDSPNQMVVERDVQFPMWTRNRSWAPSAIRAPTPGSSLPHTRPSLTTGGTVRKPSQPRPP